MLDDWLALGAVTVASSGARGAQESMITIILISLAFTLIPALAVFAMVKQRQSAQEESGEKKPVKERLLRPPGESLRCKLVELEDELNSRATLSVAIGAIVGVFVGQQYKAGEANFGLNMLSVVFVFVVSEYLLLSKLNGLLEQRRSYRLGLSGELAVGEELNKLMLDGCRVYHDFPGGDDWNIDHVIVAPSGVFAIETKARHKRTGTKEQPAHVVIYTGDALQFPMWTETKPLEQIELNARQLAKFIEQAAAESVKVTPILALPGWMVKSNVGGVQRVLSHKNVQYAVLNEQQVLSADQMKRICHQIEQKCRDVEF